MKKKYRKHTTSQRYAMTAEHAILIREIAKEGNKPQGKVLEEYLLGKRDFKKDLKEMFPYLNVV